MTDKGLYKYVYDGEIIYIGMSTSNITGRIKQHSYEEKFKPYIDCCEIYFIPMENNAEIKGCETILINKYKPLLNVTDNKSRGFTIDIENQLPSWEILKFQNKEKTVQKHTKKTPYKHTIKTNVNRWDWLRTCSENQLRASLIFDEDNRKLDFLMYQLLWEKRKVFIDDDFEKVYIANKVYDIDFFYVWIMTSADLVDLRLAFDEKKALSGKPFLVERYEWEYVHDKIIPMHLRREVAECLPKVMVTQKQDYIEHGAT